MQARFYDPIASRFLSTDPIGYQDQLNLYAYVYNDPVNAVDPNGLETLLCRIFPCSVGSEKFKEDLERSVRVYSPEEREYYRAVYGSFISIFGAASGSWGGPTSGIGNGAALGMAPRTIRPVANGFDEALSYVKGVSEPFKTTTRRGGQGLAYQGSGSGGQMGAASLFDDLTRGRPLSTSKDGKALVGSLGDGATVTMRTSNVRDVGAATTIEISRTVTRTGSRIPRSETAKVRFKHVENDVGN